MLKQRILGVFAAGVFVITFIVMVGMSKVTPTKQTDNVFYVPETKVFVCDRALIEAVTKNAEKRYLEFVEQHPEPVAKWSKETQLAYLDIVETLHYPVQYLEKTGQCTPTGQKEKMQ